jgi:hypothetical protein
MVNLLSTKNIEFKLLFAPLNYTQLYNKLVTFLDKDELKLFAKPEINNNQTNWLLDSVAKQEIIPFEQLSEYEKEIAIEKLTQLKAQICQKISNSKDKEINSLLDCLFIIPNVKNMFALKVDLDWQLLITNWGSVYNNKDERNDIITGLITKPRVYSCNVSFKFTDTLGNPKINFKFDLSYLNKEIELITDANGMHYFGACKIDSEYKFYAHINNKKRLLAALTFKQNGVYDIIVTDYSDITLKVLDQNKTPIVDEEFSIEFLGSSQNYMTNKEGLIYFSDFPVGNTLLVTDNIDKNNCAEYTVEADSSIFEFFVKRTEYLDVTVKVIDAHNNIMPAFEIDLFRNGMNKLLKTNAEGIVMLNDALLEEKIKVYNSKNQSNFVEFTVNKEQNLFVLQIVEEIVPTVKVKFIDKKNSPITNTLVEFKIKGEVVKQTTDENGYCFFPKTDFKNNEKVKLKIEVVKKKNK